MNQEITGYKISYFVFSFFISCFIVFTIHKGFQPIDIITIPVFATLLFLIIDFSAQFVYNKNMENFVKERFINHQNTEESEADIMENLENQNLPPVPNTPSCTTGNQCEFANNQVLLGCGKGMNEDYVCKNAVTKQQRTDNNLQDWAACPYQCKMEDGKCIGNFRWQSNFDSQGKALSCSPPADGTKGYQQDVEYSSEFHLKPKQSNEVSNTPLFKKFSAYEEEQQSAEEQILPKPTYMEEEHIMPHMEEEHHFPTPHIPHMEEEHKFPHMEEEHKFPHMEEEHKFPHMEEEHRMPHMEEEHRMPHMEEEHRMPQMEEEQRRPSKTPAADKKAAKAKSKEKTRPDINRHHMDDGRTDLYNRNMDTVNPININVSYNNNRPLTVNDFNEPNVDVNEMRNGRNGYWNRQKKKPLTASSETENNIITHTPADGDNTLLSPVNQTTVNTALADLNQRYYPAYLENPLNKNQLGVDVKSIFNTQNYQNQLRQQKLFNQRANRQILQRKPHWTQSNYETTMMNKILNEKNDPAPVTLDRPWSEWKSTE